MNRPQSSFETYPVSKNSPIVSKKVKKTQNLSHNQKAELIET